ncbi:MAG: hypothetical protein M3467_09090 [Actinomycetota bacterium]|nr:hypothetical protein [Actinomycetota bacterium]
MSGRGPTWDDLIARGGDGLVATMRRYLDQLTLSLAAESVRSYDTTMRQFTSFLIGFDPTLRSVAGIDRYHLEAYKQHLLARPTGDGAVVSKLTRRQRLRTVRVFFEHIIEWGYHDAPARNPVFHGDIPRRDEPLPRFLDDPTAREVHARPGRRARPVPTPRCGDSCPHRHARRRAVRPGGRRRRADR